VESKWKNYHIITFPGQSLSKNRETHHWRKDWRKLKIALFGELSLKRLWTCHETD
jgi:predicted adenine nucleotide alpha hydrolase (AANH) superfamily ATPase